MSDTSNNLSVIFAAITSVTQCPVDLDEIVRELFKCDGRFQTEETTTSYGQRTVIDVV